MELKVINEITDEIKNFKSIEEFNLYYQKHKDDMDSRTTQYLNRVYKIMTPEGTEYRITKKNCSKEGSKRVGGDVYLRKIVKTHELKELEQDVIKADIANLRNEFDDMQRGLNAEIESLRELLDVQTQRFNIFADDTNKKITQLTFTVNHLVSAVNQLSG